MAGKPFIIVFAVCHPDDEVLWAGGLLFELARLDGYRTYVICLSGQDGESPRLAEFDAARRRADYAGGVIVGGKLRPANDALPATDIALSDGLAKLNLNPAEIDLLITHAPYGDEHRHPHHVQAHNQLKAWCALRGVGFAHFACVQLPGIAHRSLLTDLRRKGSLRLLQMARCTGKGAPRFYVQFMTDPETKKQLVESYTSIGLAEHDKAYTMFTNPCEALYIEDEKALRPIAALIGTMEAPGATPLVRDRSLIYRARSKLRRFLHGKT